MKQDRRRFIKKTALGIGAAFSAPYMLTSCKGDLASKTVNLGMIGVGQHGTGWNLSAFLKMPDVRVLAVCDVDRDHCENAKKIVDEAYQNQDCSMYDDFREVLVRDDIDAVMISTPDHWHVPISIMSAQAGKHICCEKPTLTIAEGRVLVDVIKKTQCVYQNSIEDRSVPVYHRMAELVRNGYIGDLEQIVIRLPDKDIINMLKATTETRPVPEGFDYDMWLGPAPLAPYSPGRCHFNFRWVFDYSGGMLTDWGAHYFDTAQWANNSDHSGPVEVGGHGTFLSGDIYNTADTFHLKYIYANGVEMQVDSGGVSIGFKGSEGWLQCLGWRGELTASKKSILDTERKRSDIHLYTAVSEHRNFIDCVKSGKETFNPVEVGHRTASALHMGNIAMLLGRKLYRDPGKEEFKNDAEANSMRSRAARKPWRLEDILV